MLEPPNLPDEIIVAAVHASYGISLAALTFLPIGNDSASWVYRAQTVDSATYFLKVRKGMANQASVIVPRYLHDHGVTPVVAPIPTLTDTLWVDVDEFAVILYPFIDGTTGKDHGMAEHEWVTFGATLRQIHATALTPDLAQRMRRENFTPTRSGVVKRLDAHITTRTLADPSERELAAFWRARRVEIRALVDRAEVLGQRLRATSPALVLCHADIHTWNVLIDTANRLWIVDWDETVLAPKERDLMFVVGSIAEGLVGPRDEAWFFAGYGATDIDPLALAYYRYAWAARDIGAYGEQVLLLPGMGPETKRDAVEGFIDLFRPGKIVDLAYRSESIVG